MQPLITESTTHNLDALAVLNTKMTLEGSLILGCGQAAPIMPLTSLDYTESKMTLEGTRGMPRRSALSRAVRVYLLPKSILP
jgi:hypothetical protein